MECTYEVPGENEFSLCLFCFSGEVPEAFKIKKAAENGGLKVFKHVL